MESDVFCQWLKKDKNMSERAAKDVISRCKRIQKMMKMEELSICSEGLLIECESYSTCSMFVKSQLKRALFLYSEYCRSVKLDDK